MDIDINYAIPTAIHWIEVLGGSAELSIVITTLFVFNLAYEAMFPPTWLERNGVERATIGIL